MPGNFLNFSYVGRLVEALRSFAYFDNVNSIFPDHIICCATWVIFGMGEKAVILWKGWIFSSGVICNKTENTENILINVFSMLVASNVSWKYYEEWTCWEIWNRWVE